ncbi:hypothetical protein [Bradyrhizobium genosp. P]|uniref:hypothetical protein n=1 Tax=Bradyrhizobium genosp. P TaxID=83641 RepID=UPI003CF1BFC2
MNDVLRIALAFASCNVVVDAPGIVRFRGRAYRRARDQCEQRCPLEQFAMTMQHDAAAFDFL